MEVVANESLRFTRVLVTRRVSGIGELLGNDFDASLRLSRSRSGTSESDNDFMEWRSSLRTKMGSSEAEQNAIYTRKRKYVQRHNPSHKV